MSLKAKIEAVIYASEEPVTLAQLTGLLGEEGQAELDALDARQQSLSLDESTSPTDPDEDALNAEFLEPTESEPEPATNPGAPDLRSLEIGEVAATDPEDSTPEATPPTPNDDKKQARERDRKLRDYFRSLLDTLIADYATNDRGLEIREVAGGFRLATKPEYHDAVRGFVKSLKPPLKLSLQALETLAVVAYKQPVTAPEISEIRGVDSGGVLGSLLARKLITTAGRKQVIGRPILYKTTKDFLLRFGLKDINELPSIEEFEKMAGELADAEPLQEEIPMSHGSEQDVASSDSPSGAGGSAAIDEINSAPTPTNTFHESVEDILADDSTSPEGVRREHTDKTEVEPGNPEDVEPSAELHEPQADGDPGEDTNRRADDEPEQNVADDILIDGRISGPPPTEDDEDPSAIEAEIQANSKTGGA
jgi:segregation and condensation protein B